MKKILLILCCLFALAMPGRALATGQFYENTLAGNPPDPRTLSFRTWFFNLLAIRESDVPVASGFTTG
jgi:hypothetical protein